MLRFFEISSLLNAILSFAIGFLVLYKDRKSLLNQLWFAVSISIGVWALGISKIVVAESYEKAWIWNWVLYSGAIFIPIFYFHFCAVLARVKGRFINFLLVLGYTLSIFFFIFNFTPFFVEDVPPMFLFKHWVKPGVLYIPYFIYFIFYLVSSLAILILGLRKADGLLRQQLKYLLISGFFGVSGGITVFLPQLIGLYPFGSYFIILYIVGVTYAILKYRLMGIRFIVSKLYIYFLLAVFSYLYFHLVILIDNKFLGGIYNSRAWATDILFAIIFAFLFLPMLEKIQKSSDVIFYKGNNPRKIIRDLSARFSSVIELSELVKVLTEEFRKILETDEVEIIASVHDNGFSNQIAGHERKRLQAMMAKKGKLRHVSISLSNPVYQWIIKNKETLVLEEIDKKTNPKLAKEMKQHQIKIATPLKIREKVVGVVLLGDKISKSAYTKEDIEFLEIIGLQAAIAIENARLYTEVKDFNLRLKKEVKEATFELQDANEELKSMNEKIVQAYEKLHKLDRAKSEFLSIASHQLRTPLTSIKGFVSMLLDGTYGKIPEKNKQVLEKVYISNERLIKLVEDLLSISRIESGKLVFEFEKNDIKEVVKELGEFFSVAAKAKKLAFEMHITSNKIEPFYFDRGKVREMVSNLIDNAIKYTKEGKVVVKLEDRGSSILIIIADTGIGIDAKEIDYIFEKFQRGEKVSSIHTEGTGLGLYVCKKIVEAHEGKLWVESEGEGKGSTFFVKLDKEFTPDESGRKVAEKDETILGNGF